MTTDNTRPAKPEILTDIYGSTPPKAAEFGRGAQTIADIRDAADKQHRQPQNGGAYRE
jgi:hypothetical protein